MNNSVKWLSLLLAFVLLLSACTSGKGESSEEKITIRIMSVSQTEDPDGPAELAMAARYMEENPHINIEFIGVPMNDLYRKVTTLATSNDLPDAFMNTPQFMHTANEMGITTNLSEIFEEEYLSEFYPNLLRESTVDGKLQFLPWVATPYALVYRGDWFEEEGIAVPETWDDFLEVAKKMTRDTDGDGKVDRWGYGMVSTRNSSGAERFIAKLRSFGIEELKQDESGAWITELDSPKAQEAFRFLTDLNNVHGVIPPGITETGFPEAASLMANGKVAMMITGPNALGNIYSQNPELKGKLHSAPIPKGEKHTATYGLFGYAIAATSKHKEEVAKYLQYMVTKENALNWNELSGRLPTKIELGKEQELTTPDYAGFVKALDYAYATPVFSQYLQFQDIVAEAYQVIMANGVSVGEATKNAAERAREIIAANEN